MKTEEERIVERVVGQAVSLYTNPNNDSHTPRLTAVCECLMKSLEDCKEGGVLEIGVERGVTSLMFLNLMDELHDFRVLQSIDCYDREVGEPGYQDNYIQAVKRLADRTVYLPRNVVWRFYPVSDKAYMTGIYPFLSPRFQKYAFVYLDGPHDTEAVWQEVFFFADHVLPGGHMVIDDVSLFDELGPMLKEMDKLKGWELNNVPNGTSCRRLV